MAKEATITMTAQLTAIERASDKDYEKTMERFGGDLDAWKQHIENGVKEFLREEGGFDDVNLSDLKIFLRDIPEEEVWE